MYVRKETAAALSRRTVRFVAAHAYNYPFAILVACCNSRCVANRYTSTLGHALLRDGDKHYCIQLLQQDIQQPSHASTIQQDVLKLIGELWNLQTRVATSSICAEPSVPSSFVTGAA
jgi:hypothetical protein